MTKKVSDIAKFIDGQIVGDGNILIKGVNGIKEAGDGDIAFILNAQYEELVGSSAASCFVVSKKTNREFNKPVIKVDNPSAAFSKIINCIYPDRIPHPKGVHTSAVVSKKASVSKSAALGPHVVIEDGASIGDGTIIYPFCYIGKNTRIGKDCVLYPNVTVREEIVIGDRVVIHPGTVLGSDGFGYDTMPDGSHVKIPQMGVVEIEDDVELGACVTIDRARFAKTLICKGSKIDNLVQIAHNVVVGPYCLIAAQTGISGSTELGRNVVLGGQVGIADHLKLGNFVIAGAKTGITKSFPDKTTVFWYPAKPLEKAREIMASIGLLPKLFARVKALEAKIKELENK
ncbi:MAG: UDP-3-O-(3-hydroxymyristoyl)glucosamine N-acyltransferase [Candidatus Omnitrophota bacterium]|jgi:UDP-3-O-[3-hydroxymyristoyl] glucosamine N-acyltransferase